LIFILSLEVLSCAGAPPSSSRILGLVLPPRSLGASIAIQQHLTVRVDGAAPQELEAALEVDSERLELIGLGFGQRVFALSYDGNKLRAWRHPLMPPQVQAEDVLQDIQLTLWPADVIRNELPAGWRIEESGLRRTLFAADSPVIIIEYTSQPRWSGRVELTNLRYRYRLIIDSVSNGTSSDGGRLGP
jgi:hypothetical protein